MFSPLRSCCGERGHARGMVIAAATRGHARDGLAARAKATLAGSLRRFMADDVLTLAAALAFYTMLSFAPLVVLAIAASSAAGPGAENAVLDQVRAIAGEEARAAAEAVIRSGKMRPELGSVAGVAGILVLIAGATTVFAQLQSSLNLMFDVVAEPSNAIWGWLRRRVLSIGVIFAIGFVLIVSLIISALLGWLLPRGGLAMDAANQIASALVFAVLFGILFRYLPDARIGWRAAFLGGVATALLFALGKWAIGVYVARADVGGAYGAAGSLVVLLVWVYYSAAIFFYGAELTAAALDAWGIAIKPLPHASRAERSA
jgi:membrane protein